MSVVSDIVDSWRTPSTVVRRHLARGKSEPFAFVLLVVFLIICFIAQWPDVARVTVLKPDIPMAPQLLGRAMAILATIPVWYALAALGHLAARAMGGQGGWYGARMALIWALVTITPLVMIAGLVAGMIGTGPQLTAVGTLTFAAFVVFWVLNLREVGRADAA